MNKVAEGRPIESEEEAGVGEGETEPEDQEVSITMKEPALEIQSKEPEPEALTQPQQPPPVKQSRPAAVSHRSSAAARYKNVDSPVVMPSTIFGGQGKCFGTGRGSLGFGVGGAGGTSIGTLGGLGVEKVGMQFGSLSLGGGSFDSNA